LKRVGQVHDTAERVNTITVSCPSIDNLDGIQESVKVVDPRFTTVGQSASPIADALRNFSNIKYLSFDPFSLNMNASGDVHGDLTEHSEAFNAVTMAAELCGYQLEEVYGR
jgi:hypothetical protein